MRQTDEGAHMATGSDARTGGNSAPGADKGHIGRSDTPVDAAAGAMRDRSLCPPSAERAACRQKLNLPFRPARTQRRPLYG
ncbi:hypothetical protein ACFVRD_09245 [Streptomyces sp. NPDC057908]|uniref:hypothetical protein n=1 Tax=Streptomyces sp. NPDC057908 TaxID=3346276 RepID=UPI0036E5B198